jgi:three-Cys-motif partner protein
MVADISNYVGREQAFVKHFFLASYLENLVFKTASKFDHIAYVDGFSGPWQSTGDNYTDTSFGIALAALRKAKKAWKDQGRDVRMSAHLVEKAAGPYANLQAIKAKFPDIAIETYNADFVPTATKILSAIPASAFAFFFIDPKGWAIDIRQITPLLKRANSEVVFNFMFDFINRAASMGDSKIVAGLNALMPHGAWRIQLAAIDALGGGDRSATRKAVLAEAFRATLMAEGSFTYVAEIPVLQRIKDRTLYSLFYGTRHAKGIEVFRDSHVKTERQQAKVRAATKQGLEEAKTRQPSLFGDNAELAHQDISDFLAAESLAARSMLLELAKAGSGSATYGEIWPRVLEKHVLTKPDLNAIAGELRKSGALAFPGWQPRKRVPEDSYVMVKL